MTQNLHIASFNAENFSLLLDKPYTREELDAIDETTYHDMNPSIYNPNKKRTKIAEIARIIEENDFDLIGLCEICGLESLETFNRLYLDGRYDCYLHEENSTRGIFVGALLKKGRFPGAKAKNVPVNFSRNLIKLELGKKGGGIQVFVVHLKSQMGEDRGLEQRIKEVEQLSSLVRHRKCIIMGDFNGILIRGIHQFEYERFLELPVYDVLAAVGIPQNKRYTHYYFSGGKNFSQLDYIFCTHDIEVLDACVLEEEIPSSWEERNKLPSDHLFIRAHINTGVI
ncbi:MAG TPA: endonuclease/exonuclease/phosphatase family protein [Treponema sp.]|nr:endonuclease/exonuclease/phosphatase family protein [Treponema sp.]